MDKEGEEEMRVSGDGKEVVITPRDNQGQGVSVVWLLGMTEHSQDYAQMYMSRKGPFRKPLQGNYRLTFVQAPERTMEKASTKGEAVPAWYAVNDMEVDQYCRYSYSDLDVSYEWVVGRLKQEAEQHQQGHMDRVHLVGFSQGACLALEVAYSSALGLGGVHVTGGMVLPRLKMRLMEKREGLGRPEHLSVLLYSGTADQVYPIHKVRRNTLDLQPLVGTALVEEQDLGHKVSPQFWDMVCGGVCQ